MKATIVGIDHSLRSTGLCKLDKGELKMSEQSKTH